MGRRCSCKHPVRHKLRPMRTELPKKPKTLSSFSAFPRPLRDCGFALRQAHRLAKIPHLSRSNASCVKVNLHAVALHDQGLCPLCASKRADSVSFLADKRDTSSFCRHVLDGWRGSHCAWMLLHGKMRGVMSCVFSPRQQMPGLILRFRLARVPGRDVRKYLTRTYRDRLTMYICIYVSASCSFSGLLVIYGIFGAHLPLQAPSAASPATTTTRTTSGFLFDHFVQQASPTLSGSCRAALAACAAPRAPNMRCAEHRTVGRLAVAACALELDHLPVWWQGGALPTMTSPLLPGGVLTTAKAPATCFSSCGCGGLAYINRWGGLVSVF